MKIHEDKMAMLVRRRTGVSASNAITVLLALPEIIHAETGKGNKIAFKGLGEFHKVNVPELKAPWLPPKTYPACTRMVFEEDE